MRRVLILTAVDADRPWRLHPQVAVRPESFGALLYHFGTRKLSFLKDRTLLDVVRTLGDHASVREAIEAQGVPAASTAPYVGAVRTLADSNMIQERDV